MNMKLMLSGVIAVCWSLGAVAQTSQVYYVQSSKAKIFDSPSFSSRLVEEVPQGQKLLMKGRLGGWVKVERNGHEGYVPSILVSVHPPMSRVRYIQSESSEIKQGVRRRTSSFSSAAAARGLTKDDRKRADVEDGVNYRALFKMEALSVSENEIARFEAGEQP